MTQAVLHSSDADFELVKRFVLQETAIVLDESQQYLVSARLDPLAAREGYSSVSALLAALSSAHGKKLRARMVDAMTTNETSFFRDKIPFEWLKDSVLPALIARRWPARSLDIWSAATASGQEAYSIAMILREYFPEIARKWRINILATDVSEAMVEATRRARYTPLEVSRGLPDALRDRYFERSDAGWMARPELTSLVRPMPLNLSGPWPALPTMDLVFMRNVMIYFGVDTRKKILGRLRSTLRFDGYLFLGGGETPLGIDDDWERASHHGASCYSRKRGRAA